MRAALIQATIAALVEPGSSLAVRDLAATANVNPGLVHVYFESKDHLIETALDQLTRDVAVRTQNPDATFPADALFGPDRGLAVAWARAIIDGPSPVLVTGGPHIQHLASVVGYDRTAAWFALAFGWALYGQVFAARLDRPWEELTAAIQVELNRLMDVERHTGS